MALFPQTLDEIDFWDLDMFVRGDPHAAWALLRREAPVWFHDRPGGEASWCVTRYDDIRTVYGDPLLFSSERDGIMLRSDEFLGSDANAFLQEVKPMIHTDPPRHAPLRKVVSHNFTPMAIARLEEQIRGYAVECMDEAADRREVDFVTDIAHRVPAAVTFALLDIPRERWERLAQLEHQTVTSSEPEFQEQEGAQASAQAASAELNGYFVELVLGRLEDPGDDLLSQFLCGQVQGEPVRWEQVVAEAGLFLAGGLDTTRAAASAGGMLPLLQHPDQLRALRDDPTLLPTAVDEFVRWASPITSESRTVTRDTELRGRELREGDRVTVWSPSANRDERQFAEPFTYDTRRSPNRHLGFAYGEHYCLGVHLAKLTLRVEFEELLNRFAAIELVGEPERVRSNFVGGLKHLPVRLTPA